MLFNGNMDRHTLRKQRKQHYGEKIKFQRPRSSKSKGKLVNLELIFTRFSDNTNFLDKDGEVQRISVFGGMKCTSWASTLGERSRSKLMHRGGKTGHLGYHTC